jgi:hypothetical protein
MPQHIWSRRGTRRICDACDVVQTLRNKRWTPDVNAICPGDDQRKPPRNTRPPPAGSPRQLEDA